MAKITFKVSARTARLIGMQNFANAEGAMIELVKNCYDADAEKCVIIFDNKYIEIPDTLSVGEFKQFEKHNVVASSYIHDDKSKSYKLNSKIPIAVKTRLKEFFRLQCKVYIVDNGVGMTDSIIKNYWMVIGTNNKQYEIYTKKNRIKTGEKGIGRFALDRMGNKAEMWTKPHTLKYGKEYSDRVFGWEIEWSIFDQENRTVDEIEVELIDDTLRDFSDILKVNLPLSEKNKKEIDITNFSNGTLLEISDLRDVWDDYNVEKLFSTMELLIPPKEVKNFVIYIYTTKNPDNYGEVLPSICDNYDYKLKAKIDNKMNAHITIHRNEYDLNKFNEQIFDIKEFTQQRFLKKDFERGYVKYTKSLAELIPGFKEVDEFNSFEKVGSFTFILYFLKYSASKQNKEIFLYKDFIAAERKVWLNSFAGIKIFRDNFRVRPYGEKGSAFDWLNLGDRASSSPAGVAKQGGGWKVRPKNISGIIKISRLTNIDFEDVSSRAGVQETPAFSVFKKIITSIIEEFEKDRIHIANTLRNFYRNISGEIPSDRALEIAKRVEQESHKSEEEKSEAEKTAEVLAKYVKQQQETIKQMESEQQLLRVLASVAVITASFAHELHGIQNNLITRIDDVRNVIQTIIDKKSIEKMEEFNNPFILLDDIKNDDIKLKEWIKFAIDSLKRDKRRRRNINFSEYFKKYKKFWEIPLQSRGINLISEIKNNELKIKTFEVDIDSIFNNLLANSIEAFLRPGAPFKREIKITVDSKYRDIFITYRDSGPGLSKDIAEPDIIFDAHFTTKRNPQTGEETGTGLGMWLLNFFVEQNNGNVTLLFDEPGFGLQMKFINKAIG